MSIVVSITVFNFLKINNSQDTQQNTQAQQLFSNKYSYTACVEEPEVDGKGMTEV